MQSIGDVPPVEPQPYTLPVPISLNKDEHVCVCVLNCLGKVGGADFIRVCCVSESLGNGWVENVSARVLTDTQLLNCG